MNEATATKCAYCGTEFDDPTGKRKFCSMTCANRNTAENRKGAGRKTGQKRRFISSSVAKRIVEPHDEVRSLETNRLQGVRSRLRDEVVSERDLIVVQFRPTVIAATCGIDEYEYRTVGAVVTEDAYEIQLLEHAVRKAREANNVESCREYSFAKEEAAKEGANCKGNADTRLQDANIQE